MKEKLGLIKNLSSGYIRQTPATDSGQDPLAVKAMDQFNQVHRNLAVPETTLFEIFDLVAGGKELDIDRMKYGLTPLELDEIINDAKAALRRQIYVANDDCN